MTAPSEPRASASSADLGLLARVGIGILAGAAFSLLLLPFHFDPFRGLRGVLASMVAGGVYFAGIGALGALRRLPITVLGTLAGTLAGFTCWGVASHRPAVGLALLVGALLGFLQSLEGIDAPRH